MTLKAGDSPIRIGDWRLDPVIGEIARAGEDGAEIARLEPRTTRLLLYLAERAGEVVSVDELLANVWTGVIVTPDSVYQAVTALRRLLRDDPKRPTYIATVPRRGYRLVAVVEPWTEPPTTPPGSVAPRPGQERSGSRYVRWWVAGSAMLAVLLVASQRYWTTPAAGPSAASRIAEAQPERSIAVLPFLDLTEGMREEEFADGITEELIGRISRIPGVRVSAPTASFYYKEKQLPVADIARALDVVYLLDGSVRKSAARVRVAARLVRGSDGFVIWSESYERPFTDLLKVQDDIASEVARALAASIDAPGDAP